MCGIVGLFFKDDQFNPRLGELLAPMLISMTDRGPDSAGFAVYGDGDGQSVKITVHAREGGVSVDSSLGRLERELSTDISIVHHDNHTVVMVPKDMAGKAVAWLSEHASDLHIMSVGSRMEIYKDVGRPGDIAKRYRVGTRCAAPTPSATPGWRPNCAVTTDGAHPFSTGVDQCLVHNGSLSNHNRCGASWLREGSAFDTENDTEVAAAYLSWRMRQAIEPRPGAGSVAGRPRRLLHLRGRHRERLRRVARSDRLQARGDGGNRPLCRVRHRIPRAGRPARHRRAQRLGAGAREGLFLGTRRSDAQTSRCRPRSTPAARAERGAASRCGADTQRDRLARPQSARAACARGRRSTRRSRSRSTAMSAITAPA